VDPRLLTLRLALLFLVPGTIWVIYLKLNGKNIGKT